MQVDKVVDIFEGLTKGNAQGLFLFDNVPSHQKCTLNVISAWHMPKSAFLFLSPLTHLTQRLITPPRRSKGKLDTLRRWDTHAQWQTSNWWKPALLLPPRSSYDAKLVQGDGDHYLQVRAVASRWSAGTVPKLLLPSWKNRLLLLLASFFAAWFRWTEASFTGIYQTPQSLVWLLPQVPLWDKLYQAVLGSGKASISGHGACSNNSGVGEKGGCIPWWYSFTSHLAVSPFLSFSLIFLWSSWLGLQTDRCSSCQHTVRVSLACRHVGPIKNIMAIVPYPQRW